MKRFIRMRPAGVPVLMLTAAALTTAAPTVAQQQTLTLRNGDRMTGVLKDVSATAWTFTFSGADVEVPLGDIASFRSNGPIGVRLSDGAILAADVTVSNGTADLQPTAGAQRSIALSEIAAVGAADRLELLQPLEIGLFSPITRFWKATGSFGFTDQSGNSRARGLAVGFDFERSTDRDRISVNLGLVREETPDSAGNFEATVSKYYGKLRGEVFTAGELFTFAQTRFERDTFQDLSLRSTGSVGLGYRVLDTDLADLRLSGSGGARYESYESGGDATTGVGALASDLKILFNGIQFDWGLEFTENFNEFDDYQIRSETAVTLNVLGGVGVRLGLLNEYDNLPQPGVEKHDMLFTTTLTYSIGN